LNLHLDDLAVCTTDRSDREGLHFPRDGMGSPRSMRSPREGWRSPRSNSDLFAFAEERERAQTQDGENAGEGERRRSRSPTYFNSENWMGYSTKKERFASDESFGELMPSSNFSSKSRRKFTGHVQLESEDQVWSPRGGDELAKEAAPDSITNIVDGKASKGKKVHITKESQDAKRRLTQDWTQPEEAQTQKKHIFPDSPQSKQQLEEFKSSPRLSPPTPLVQNGASTARSIIDVQHRTSAEMASSMMPDENEHGASAQQRKYMVGRQVISWANCGRRGATECFQNTQRVAAQISQEAGGRPQVPLHSLRNTRDHRNSDLLREHLKAPPIKWQEKLPTPPQGMPIQMCSARFSPRAAPERQDGITYTYGDVSALPSSMSKETAYLQSGLKMHTNVARTPGYFSLLEEKAPASRVIMSYQDKAIPVPHPMHHSNGYL